MAVRMKPDVNLCELEHRTVLLDEATGRFWQLNETGAGMLTELLAGASAEDVARRLAHARQVAEATVLADVGSLLDDLTRADLIERS